MNKKILYISTLATTGIMALTSLAGTVNAATSLGSYRELVKGISSDKVAPYILKDNKDRLTIADIAKEYNVASFNGVKGYSGSTVVKTGDTFVADKEDYEVIVYGDVAEKGTNGIKADGKVDSNDANVMLKLAVAKDKSTLVNNTNLEAADIVNDGVVDSKDANLALLFAVGKGSIDVKLNPEDNNTGYTINMKANYANNQNQATVPVEVKGQISSDMPYTLALRVLDSNGDQVGTDISVNATANTVITSKTANISLAGENDGTYTVQLVGTDKKSKETVLAKTTIVLNTKSPKAAKVSTERTAWNSAKMSLSSMGETEIAKVYYVVLPSTSPALTNTDWDATKSEFTGKTTKSAKVANGKVTDEVVSTELSRDTAYTVYYVLENTYGSVSKDASGNVVVGTANVLSDAIKNSQTAVDATKIVLPKLAENNTKFTWEAVKDASNVAATGYDVTVYKDGKIIAEGPATITASGVEYDISGNLAGAGKYKIEIVAKGANLKNSAPVMSGEVTVRQLNAIAESSIKFEVNQQGKSVLSWSDINNKADVEEYKVEVFQYKNATKDYDTTADASAITVAKITDTNVELTLTPNVAYKAVIQVMKKSTAGADVLDSGKSELEGFYRIDPTGKVTSVDVAENTITLNITDDIEIKGKKITNYDAKVYTVQTANSEVARHTEQKQGITTKYEDGKLVISGLQPNTQYAYKLIANANGTKGESGIVEQDQGKNIVTLKTAPKIQNKTVVTAVADAKAGTVYYDAGTKALRVDGTDAITLDTTYAKEFVDSVAVISKLRAGDVVSIDKETVELLLTDASTTAGKAIDFGETVKGKTVILKGKVFGYEVSVDNGFEAKEIRLSGAGAKYDLGTTVADKFADKITVDNGVIVSGSKTYTTLAGQTVTINGVKVKTDKNTEIASKVNASSEKELEVTVTGERNGMTFENVIADNVPETDAKITFKAAVATVQYGEITIKTTGGKVTVTQSQVNVSGDLKVEVNSGEVNISDPALTGTKTVNVTNSENKKAIVTVNTKMAAPVAIPAGTEIREYTEKDYEDATLTAKPNATTAEEKALVNQYMAALKLEGKGATIKTAVAKDASVVTIEFTEATTATIGGVK